MSRQDVEFFQSFVRKYINTAIRAHFKDVTVNDPDNLDVNNPREAAKKLCLHKNTDTLTLTIGRLLFWWIETRGLLEEFIYGIPATNFHESVAFKPQIVLYWREKIEDARKKNRYPIRARYSVRWRGDYATRGDIDKIRVKINDIFNKPNTHQFTKGRIKYSYRDKIKGYEFIVSNVSDLKAKELINKLLEIQGDNPLNPNYLTKSYKDEADWDTTETIKVDGRTEKLPKLRQIGRVYFTRAELKVHGNTRDILLTDNHSVLIPPPS